MTQIRADISIPVVAGLLTEPQWVTEGLWVAAETCGQAERRGRLTRAEYRFNSMYQRVSA